jgi:hypothetical protein
VIPILRPGERVSLAGRPGTVKDVEGGGIYVTLKMDDGSALLAVGTHLKALPKRGNGKE